MGQLCTRLYLALLLISIQNDSVYGKGPQEIEEVDNALHPGGKIKIAISPKDSEQSEFWDNPVVKKWKSPYLESDIKLPLQLDTSSIDFNDEIVGRREYGDEARRGSHSKEKPSKKGVIRITEPGSVELIRDREGLQVESTKPEIVPVNLELTRPKPIPASLELSKPLSIPASLETAKPIPDSLEPTNPKPLRESFESTRARSIPESVEPNKKKKKLESLDFEMMELEKMDLEKKKLEKKTLEKKELEKKNLGYKKSDRNEKKNNLEKPKPEKGKLEKKGVGSGDSGANKRLQNSDEKMESRSGHHEKSEIPEKPEILEKPDKHNKNQNSEKLENLNRKEVGKYEDLSLLTKGHSKSFIDMNIQNNSVMQRTSFDTIVTFRPLIEKELPSNNPDRLKMKLRSGPQTSTKLGSCKPGYVAITIRGDAIFCTKIPACGGTGPHPDATSCPMKNSSAAVGGCRPSSPSYNVELDQCILQEDSTCEISTKNTWVCVLPKPASTSKSTIVTRKSKRMDTTFELGDLERTAGVSKASRLTQSFIPMMVLFPIVMLV